MLPAELGSAFLTIILCSSVLYELIGPASAKAALVLAGVIPRDISSHAEELPCEPCEPELTDATISAEDDLNPAEPRTCSQDPAASDFESEESDVRHNI